MYNDLLVAVEPDSGHAALEAVDHDLLTLRLKRVRSTLILCFINNGLARQNTAQTTEPGL